MQNDAVVLLLSTQLSKIKHCVVINIPSLSPYVTLKATKCQYVAANGSTKAERPANNMDD